jgi:hypothetical protein
MGKAKPTSGAVTIGWWLSCALAASAWCLTASPQLSATFDEPLYVRAGLECWRSGSNASLIHVGTLPLPMRVQALPAYLSEQISGRPWDMEADFRTLLHLARAGNLLFLWLLLGYGWLIARQLAGAWAGRLAVLLLACEPNVLAHATLATADIAVSACLLMLCYHYRQGRERGVWLRVVLPGLLYAVAMMAKASALAFGPLCVWTIELARLRTRGGKWTESARDLLLIGVLGLGLLLVLCGTDCQPLPSFARWATTLPDGLLAQSMRWLAENLCIFPNAAEALVRQIKHNAHGHATYLLGQDRAGAFWYYFPVVLTMKLTVPVLLLLLGGVVAATLGCGRRGLTHWCAACALVLLAFSLNCRVQIGIRLVLPLVVFLVLTASLIASHWAQQGPTMRRGLLVLVAWAVGVAGWAWPDALRYINPVWGGPERAHLLVSDSNCDWGQGLIELQQSYAGQQPLSVWYFGTDPLILTGPWRHVPLHTLPVRDLADVRRQVPTRRLAVSLTLLYGHPLTEPHRHAAQALRTLTPVARTRTFFIYELP